MGGVGVTLNEPWGDQLLINHNHAIQGLVLLWTVSL